MDDSVRGTLVDDAAYSTILDAATVGDREKPAKASEQVYRNLLDKIRALDPVTVWTSSSQPLGRLTVKGQASAV